VEAAATGLDVSWIDMEKPEVTRLYKYCALSAQILESIRSRAFWFSKPRAFNDPFDCAIQVHEDALGDSFQHALSRTINHPHYVKGSIPESRMLPDERDAQAFTEFRSGINSVLRDTGVLCLTESCDSLLMWGHYAASHQGFCIGFERTPRNLLGRLASPVQYSHHYPRLTSAHFDSATNQRSLDHLWLTKAAEWSYEREWRLVEKQGDRRYRVDVDIVEVIFGARSTPETRTIVSDSLHVGKHPTRARWATVAQREFRIEIVDSRPPDAS
jgi:hypothetical protein